MFNLFKRNKTSKAFTLVEVLVVLSVMSVLFAIVFTAGNVSHQKALNTSAQVDLNSYSLVLKNIGTTNRSFDGDLDQLAAAINAQVDQKLWVVVENGRLYSEAEDPWGNRYQITQAFPENSKGALVVTSFGKDLKQYTEDDITFIITLDTSTGYDKIVITDSTKQEGHVHLFEKKELVREGNCTQLEVRNYKCVECGSVEQREIPGTASGHDFSRMTASETYLNNPATCTAKATYFYNCSRCRAKGENTFEFGELASHIPETTYTCNSVTHTYKCRNCVAIAKTEACNCCTHPFYTETVTKEATCKETGIKTYQCNSCTYSYTETIEMTDHLEWDVLTRAATCTVDGQITYTCKVCGFNKYENIPNLGGHKENNYICDKANHKYYCKNAGCTELIREEICDCPTCSHPSEDVVEIIEQVATCISTGRKIYHCYLCGSNYKSETIPATGIHSYDRTVDKNPTCTEAGIEKFVCNTAGCDAHYTEDIPATGHSEILTTTQPTCLADGKTVKTCTNDGCTLYEIVDELPALGHLWGSTATKIYATCETEGTKSKTCSRCGAVEEYQYGPEGHIEGGYECNNIKHTYKCQRSGCNYEIKSEACDCISVCLHTNTTVTEVWAADANVCLDGHSKVTTCNDCKQILSREDIAPYGHLYGETTCNCSQHITVCSRNSEHIKVEDCNCEPKHNYELTNTTTVNCVRTETYKCSKCSDAYTTETIVHVWKLIASSDGDCKNLPYKKYKCNNCDRQKTDYGSSYGDHVTTTTNYPATCETDAYSITICSVCSMNETVTNAGTKTGHNMQFDTSLAPTCTTKGWTRNKCVNEHCNKTETTEIDKLGHDVNVDTEKSTPAYCNYGSKTYYYCARTGCSWTDFEDGVDDFDADNHLLDTSDPETGVGYGQKDATCTEDGYIIYQCRYCSYTKQVDYPKLGHSWSGPTDSHVGTCRDYDQSWSKYECVRYNEYNSSYCGETKVVYDENTECQIGDWVIVSAATCTKSGLQTRKCIHECGVEESEDIEPLGHDYSLEQGVYGADNCQEQEYTIWQCSFDGCSSTYTEYGNYGPHDYYKSDCSGSYDTWSCSVSGCTDSYTEPCTCHVCSYTIYVGGSSGDCQNASYEIYKCSCGNTDTTYGAYGPHQFGSSYSCDGSYHTYTCDLCDETDIEECDCHVCSYDTYVGGSSGNCQSKSYEIYKCSCGNTDTTYGSYGPHEYSSSTSWSGCDYTTTYTCDLCDDSYYDTGTSHSYCSGGCGYCVDCNYCHCHTHNYLASYIQDATCTEDGYTLMECSCGDSYETNQSDALGHDYCSGGCGECLRCSSCDCHVCSYDTYVGGSDGDCCSKSYEIYECSCGATNTTYGFYGPHNYSDATCEDPETCTICDETNGSPLGHDYRSVGGDSGDCENKSYTEYECDRCGDSYTSYGGYGSHDYCDVCGNCTICSSCDSNKHDLAEYGACSLCPDGTTPADCGGGCGYCSGHCQCG